MKKIYIIFALCTLGCASLLVSYSPIKTRALSFISSPEKIRILIVPGHEPDSGGAEFKNILERNLTVQLSNDLKETLEKSGKYTVFTTRDEKNWNPVFANYFKKNWDSIVAWQKTSKKDDNILIASGLLAKPVQIVRHNNAPKEVATRLYGITKWANENQIDLMIHVHINDDSEHRKNVTGKYSGFAIYVPVYNYDNGKKSHEISRTIFDSLHKNNPVSDLEQEKVGIIDEPRLIAVGAHNTSSAASVLIEYGYIYEPKFARGDLRSDTLSTLAYQTYLGLQDYFNK